MDSFEKKRNALYDAAVADAKENGYELLPGRQLTPVEQRALDKSFQETSEFIGKLRAWRTDSRKRVLWAN